MFASYNAGGGNVSKWIEAYGDPRSPSVDPVDWVERIPFTETRNYVQRVMENLHVYRSRLNERSASARPDEKALILANPFRKKARSRDRARGVRRGFGSMVADGFAPLWVSASDGLKLFARDYGPPASSALPAVCLPGLSRNSSDFHDLALALAGDAKRPRRVLALDYRGRGRSDYDPDPEKLRSQGRTRRRLPS